MHRHKIYPIVISVRFKSVKHIRFVLRFTFGWELTVLKRNLLSFCREVKDGRFCNEKISSKVAKDMLSEGLKTEQDYRFYISGILAENKGCCCSLFLL